MKRQAFINELRKALANVSASEREDILRDQEEYLHEAELAGRNEDEVIEALGDPKQLAVSLNAQAKIQKMEKETSFPKRIRTTFGAVMAMIALAPFNFIFVLWPFLIAVGFDLMGWIFAGGSLLAAVMFLGTFIFKLIFISVGFWTHLAAFFLALTSIGVALIFVFFMAKVTSLLMDLTIRYLKWNLNLIKGKT